MPDLSGDVAFEAPDRFEFGLAFGLFAVDVGAGVGIQLGAAERDDVDRAVQLPVTAAVQAVAVGFSGAGGDRCGAGVPGEARFAAEPLRAGGAADDHRRGDGADALLREQLRRVRLEQLGELREQLLLLLADLVDPSQLRFGDAQLRAGWQLPELAGEPGSDPWALQCCRPELRLDLRRDPDQVPAQPVDQPHALVHQLISVIAEHPDLMRLLVQERDRQVLDALADRGQRHSPGIDRIGLPWRPGCLPGLPGQ